MSLNIRFEHNGKVKGITLFPGIQQDELQTILKSIFGFSGNVVGFVEPVRRDMILNEPD
jgi:hypothetical protein